jgi:deoxyadenosine/deoxycytidine kinase
MPPQDFELYKGIYDLVADGARPIGFVIWARAAPDTMLARIRERGRPFEQSISREYLEAIDAEYERWFAALPEERRFTVDTTSRGSEETADTAADWLREVCE